MMSPLLGQTIAETPAQTERTSQSAQPTSGAPAPRNVPAQTMMGLPVAPQRSQAPVVVEPGRMPGKLLTEPSVAPSQPEPLGRRTSFGVDESASSLPVADRGGQGRGPAASNMTMLGVAPLATPDSRSAEKPAEKPAGRPVISPQSHHTMLGNAPAPLPAQPPQAAARPHTPASVPAQRRREDGSPRSFTPVPMVAESRDSQASRAGSAPPVPPVRRGLWLLVGLCGGAALLALGGLALWLFTRQPEVSVRVVSLPAEGAAQAGGDALEVEVPGAKPGARVRFGGEEYPLTASRARFPLRADALSLGENALAVSVVSPGGEVDTATVQLVVDYRVRADLAALEAQPPGVDVVIDARPGSRVTLDGTTLALDARGRGTRRYPIPPQTAAAFVLRAQYHIDLPSGDARAAPVEGHVEVSLPVTTAQIDRPGPDVITDQALLEVAGAVEPGAVVVVGGTAVPVTEGRFLYRAHLPQPGEYKLAVVARAPGKAPRVVDIRVRRVSDMGMAAATFKHDPTLTYARIAQNPLIYRGQSVAFDGRVYNVDVQGGRSVLQMLALDCPGGARCPLWVEVPQATEATEGTWVRVLGTVAGEQQFRSKQGPVQTVPSVQAQYVLKLAR